MAVPKKKTSKTKKRTRRAHDRVTAPTLVHCQCGALALPHRVCPSCGRYRAKEYLRAVNAE